ncbi:uncharacterized protein LOC124163607 [Ischnura elegans]|uniref:uncharacterized protein LOC124163607 n=1 Tax=Ischnura elegans TaxID=197161 RepID=UPI001ED86F47|nr:uncharacterized protein LOC124163607 [Ischnura elegans]
MERLVTTVAKLRWELSAVEASVSELKERIKSVEMEMEKLRLGEKDAVSKSSGGRSLDCVDAILGKTTILNSDEAKVQKVRQLYDTLRSQGEFVTSVMTYLGKKASGLAVRFDCDSDHLGNVQGTFTSLTGAILDGRRLQNHADCSKGEDGMRCVVSMAALETPAYSRDKILGRLARTLARAALHFAFGNGGLPYSSSDSATREEFRNIVESICKRRTKKEGSCELASWALESSSQDVREMGLICSVPEIVVESGEENGRQILSEQFPELLRFYERHILAKLLE